ncbi:MAG: competence/damage-inducible protein A [Planctomycetes bacterium]|nr:competence/damage-inducible protein A [Planctomycetota bacterium]
MDAIIISVGNELTAGQTVDTNTAWLSQRLAEIGAHVTLHVTVADEVAPLEREIRRACELADVVLITGGLGHTEDDLTREALATVLGVGLELNERCLERIRAYFTQRQRPMPQANTGQAMFPIGSTPIDNTCGTAPGIRAAFGRATIYVMPGVPREMQVMYERDVGPELQGRAAGAVILARTIQTFGAGESEIGERIRDLMSRGRNPTVGTTAQQAVIGVRIHAAGAGRTEAEHLLERTAAEIKSRLGPLVFGEDDDTLWSVVTRQLIAAGKKLSTAESCTGGLIAASITDTPGSSACFIDGVVTYSNAAKTRLLAVPADLIAAHGAVSRPVAEAMAHNCRRLSGSDYAISVTGIAGPSGGTPEKPVGLVYIGLADGGRCDVHEVRLGSFLTRSEIRDRARKYALNLLRLRLMGR